MNQFLRFTLFVVMLCVGVSCGDNPEESGKESKPVITLDSSSDSYNIAVNEYIIISPTYENITNATFVWSVNGDVLSTEKELKFITAIEGNHYIELAVKNSAGTTYKEILIVVESTETPVVDLGIATSEYIVGQGIEFSIYPAVSNCDSGATYVWTLNGDEIATTKDLHYTIDDLGSYELRLTLKNSDGSGASDAIKVKVVEPEDLPFGWDFERSEYNLAIGREVRIKCWNVENDFGGDYVWSLDGVEQQRGDSKKFVFEGTVQGEYNLKVAKYDGSNEKVAEHFFDINVCAVEGTYRRDISSSSSKNFSKVYEFAPAPGQFVNFGYSTSTPQEACDYAEQRLRSEAHVSLGGFGGYIVVGFDHSVTNSGGYDLEIQGNQIKTSNEPGIVMVMQDENGDGMPNDTWYELKGSDTSDQIADFSVKYYRPANGGDRSAQYRYTTNRGDSGSIKKVFNSQDYWAAWSDANTMTFYGTALSPRNSEISVGYWVNGAYDWGYVDNYSDVDILSPSDEYIDAPRGNHFRISDAVDYKGEKVDIQYVDFVKVYSAVCSQSGNLGELSTEVLRISDFNMNKRP